jgi:steroid 5-alpha reductase family enzyme
MKKSEIKILIENLIIIIIATALSIAISFEGKKILNGIPLYAFAVIVAFLIQWIVFIPSFIFKTEKYYDLTGSLTYTSVIILSVVISGNFDLRSIFIMSLVLIWAFRLGIFLFRRIIKAGEDKRFKDMKKSGLQFFRAWTLQGLWVSFTLAAALAAITAPKDDFGIYDGITFGIGLLIWIIGFGFEAIADFQKKKFRKAPNNQGKFINVGLWSISRHPNYFGEITLWIGIAIISLPTLEGWRWFALISPLFVFLLITKISGVPLLENYADKKWGGQVDYEKYKIDTPVLLPKLFKKTKSKND